MASVNLAVSLQVPAGPRVSVTQALGVEAYDLTAITVAPGGTEHSVEIQPGAADQVSVLLVRSSRYGSEITYKVSDGSSDSAQIEFLQPHLYTAGMLGWFGVDPPTTLKFTNALADTPENAVQIDVFVGRNATS